MLAKHPWHWCVGRHIDKELIVHMNVHPLLQCHVQCSVLFACRVQLVRQGSHESITDIASTESKADAYATINVETEASALL